MRVVCTFLPLVGLKEFFMMRVVCTFLPLVGLREFFCDACSLYILTFSWFEGVFL